MEKTEKECKEKNISGVSRFVCLSNYLDYGKICSQRNTRVGKYLFTGRGVAECQEIKCLLTIYIK